MARITFSQASLLGGVSQQPDVLRLPNQCEEQINFVPSPVDGLYRRNGMQYVATLEDSSTAPARVFPLIRDNNEQYVLVATEGELRVFGLDGTEYGIYSEDGITPPSWTYLSGTDPSLLKVLNVADHTFVLNTTRSVPMQSVPKEDADTIATHAYLSVIQGQYKTDYTVTLDPIGGSWAPETFVVSTWDGDTALSDSLSKWRISFSTGTGGIGQAGDVWEVEYQDSTDVTQTLQYTVQSGDGAYDVALAFRDLFDADPTLTVSGVKLSSGSHWRYFSVEAKSPTHSAPGTGPWNLEIDVPTAPTTATAPKLDEIQEPGVEELGSIKTTDIAEALADEINQALSGLYTAEVYDHVIRLTSTVIVDVAVDDSSSEDLIYLCNRSVENISQLPTRCLPGYSAKVRGEAKGTEDDYWVTFRRESVLGQQYVGVGEGFWEEGRPLYAPGDQGGDDVYKRSFFVDNMPWQLVRRFTDPGGDVYFTWEKPAWNLRDVGDGVSNPPPSFVGQNLDDIIFWRNRLGLVAGSNVVFSEAGQYFNFWRTSVKQLLDSDPVDIQSNLKDVIEFTHAVEIDGDLLLTSDKVQVRLEAEPVLAPTTAAMRSVLRLQVDTERGPEVVGRGAMIPFQRGEWSGLHEIYRSDEVNYDYQDITEQVPHYIDGRVRDITSSPADNVACVLTDAGLYLYNFFIRGRDKLQSAWSKLDVGGEVLGAAFFESDLYLTVRDTEQVNLYKIPFESSYRDPTIGWDPRIDRRVTWEAGESTYIADEDVTALALPYYVDPSETDWWFVALDTGDVVKALVNTTNPSVTVLAVPGDWSNRRFCTGKAFTSTYRLSRVMVRESVGERVAGVTSGRTQLLLGKLSFRNSGYAKVEVDHGFSSVDLYEYTGPGLGTGGLLTDYPVVNDDEFEFPVYGDAENVRVTVSSSSCLPLSLVGSEWTVDFSQRATRYRG